MSTQSSRFVYVDATPHLIFQIQHGISGEEVAYGMSTFNDLGGSSYFEEAMNTMDSIHDLEQKSGK